MNIVIYWDSSSEEGLYLPWSDDEIVNNLDAGETAGLQEYSNSVLLMLVGECELTFLGSVLVV